MAVTLRSGTGPQQGSWYRLLDSLPSSPISEMRVERLEYRLDGRMVFRGEWRCTVTDVRAVVNLELPDDIRPDVAYTEVGYSLIAWCHLFHSRLHEAHAALLRFAETAGREAAAAAMRAIIDSGFGDRCLADARRLAASADSDAALLRRVRPYPYNDRLYYSRVEDPNDWRLQPSQLYGDFVDGAVATGRPTTATEIAMRQSAIREEAMQHALQYGTALAMAPWRLEMERLRNELMRDLLQHAAFGPRMPQVGVDDATASAMSRAAEVARGAAIARARGTLVSCLNPAQLEQFNATGEFDVVMSRTQGWPRGRYRIRQRRTFTVLHVETGDEYCAVIDDASCPVFDQMLAMKLLLEIEPARFFATANRSAGFRPGLLTRAAADLARVVAGTRQDAVRFRPFLPFGERAAERGAELAASPGLLNGREL